MKTIVQTLALLLLTVFPLPSLLGQTPPQATDFWDVQRVYDWDSTQNNWLPTYRLSATRNASGQMTQSLYEEYDGTNYVLKNRTSTYPGTTNNHPTKSYFQENWVNNAWENSFRVSVPLDASGGEIGNYHEFWNGSSWDTTLAYRNTNVTNANNQLTEQVYSKQTANGWEIESRNRYSYDANMELDTFYVDAYLSGNWFPATSRVDYTWFDFSQNLPSSYSTQIFTGLGLTYDRKFEYTYAVNQIVETITSFNNTTPLYNTRNTQNFDAQGRRTQIIYENYNASSNAWEYDNDLFYNITYFNHSSGPQPTEIIQTTGNQLGQPVNYRKQEFDYTVVGLEDSPAFSGEVQVYPNPFLDHIRIQAETITAGTALLSLLDAKGKQVLTRELKVSPGTNSLLLPLPQLPAGIYHYHISLHGDNITGKLVH